MTAYKMKYPGISITTNSNQLVSLYTEARNTEAGVFCPITPSTEIGEMYEFARAKGRPNVFGRPNLAIEAEGEHAANVDNGEINVADLKAKGLRLLEELDTVNV